MKKISIITPCFNEEENVTECARRVKKVLEEDLSSFDYEHIFVDNSSSDGTSLVLKELAESDSKIKVIVNSRNVGPFRNMWIGMRHATGDILVPMVPADLQDPPEIIPQLVEKWENGYLVVYGIRRNREESLLMRMIRKLYYKAITKFSNEIIPVSAGEFMLLDRKVVNSFINIDDHYPYIRGLVAQTGIKSTAVEYTWVKRRKGKSKNNFLDLIDQGINGFISTSRVLLRFSLLLGVLFGLVGFAAAIFTFLNAIRTPDAFSFGMPTLIISFFILSGLQLVFLGIIGEYLLSVHRQVRKQPEVFAVEKYNF